MLARLCIFDALIFDPENVNFFSCENEIKYDFPDKQNFGEHSKGLDTVDESNMEREKGRKKNIC